ncbi:MAG TPA: hypothetical protein VF589_11960 [Allosphingosinicella sp.]|jgi:hypothetical protein
MFRLRERRLPKAGRPGAYFRVSRDWRLTVTSAFALGDRKALRLLPGMDRIDFGMAEPVRQAVTDLLHLAPFLAERRGRKGGEARVHEIGRLRNLLDLDPGRPEAGERVGEGLDLALAPGLEDVVGLDVVEVRPGLSKC